VTEMKEISLDYIQMGDGGLVIGERGAEAATLDDNLTKIKGGNAGVGGVGSER